MALYVDTNFAKQPAVSQRLRPRHSSAVLCVVCLLCACCALCACVLCVCCVLRCVLRVCVLCACCVLRACVLCAWWVLFPCTQTWAFRARAALAARSCGAAVDGE